MEPENMIPVSEFCIYHNIELSFIYSLNESGLIDITSIGRKNICACKPIKAFRTADALSQEMDINIEGIEAITHLLKRIKDMQLHIVQLTNKLSFYESI